MSENPYTDPDPYQTPTSNPLPMGQPYQKPSMKELLFSFQGRVPRRVFWGVILIGYLIVGVVAAIMISLLGEETGPLVAMVAFIPFIWCALAVQVKRWHDRDKSGWWVLIGMIPIVGIWALIENGFLRGTHGSNSYGEDPT